MWPFKKKRNILEEPISFSQVDITEYFDDDQKHGPGDWVPTMPLNRTMKDPESMGLPPIGGGPEEVYRVASNLSELRELLPIPGEGVYCPVCHVANVDIEKLQTPCAFCGRNLLKFGWD